MSDENTSVKGIPGEKLPLYKRYEPLGTTYLCVRVVLEDGCAIGDVIVISRMLDIAKTDFPGIEISSDTMRSVRLQDEFKNEMWDIEFNVLVDEKLPVSYRKSVMCAL